MSRGAKVFVSCAAGAGIGALVALELNTYLWWIGLLVGALVGYLSYEFKKVVRAIPMAWNKAVNWRPDWELMGLRFKYFYYIALITVPWFTVFVLFTARPDSFIIGIKIFPALGLFVSFIFAMAVCSNDNKEEIKNFLPKFRYCALRLNIAVAPFFLLYLFGKYAPRFLFWQMPRFLWQFFKLIHSEIRVLCAVDAAIGAFIGYAFGNALIGAIAGGVIGLLNYEIVSKLWLKLVPVKDVS